MTDTNPFEPAPGIIRDVPLELIHDSEAQQDEVYDEAYIAELGASIKAHGSNHTPILLRPRPQGLPGYETAFGHHRKRGCAWAGLSTCRAEIRDLTDLEMEQAQLSENLNRRIASPLEEASRFGRLMRVHKLKVEQLMANFGKSKGYIYGRLSLLKLSDAVRKAMAQGLTTEVALEIATHSNERIQQLAISKARALNGEWLPVRVAKQILRNEFTIRLAEAPFDLKDEKLHKPAGDCSSCPKLACNAPEMADLPADTCTDRDCYDIKVEEHWQHVVMQLQDEGHTVLQDDDAIRGFSVTGSTPLTMSFAFRGATHKVSDMIAARPEGHPNIKLTYVAPEGEAPRGYIARADLDRLMEALGLVQPARQHAQAPAVQAPGSRTSNDGIDDAPEDATQHPADVDWPFPSGRPPAATAAQQQPEQLSAQGVAANHWKGILLPAVMKAAAARERTTDDLRLVVDIAMDFAADEGIVIAATHMGWPDDCDQGAEDWLRAQLPTLSADQLGLLVVLMAVACDAPGYGSDQIEARIAMAERFGVDVLALAPKTDADEDEDKEDDEDTPDLVVQSPKPQVLKYRNPGTGETWSGRGLQPKWLKAAIAAGNKLSDYVVEGATA